MGVQLNFVVHADGEVSADFRYGGALQSYDGVLHGGVVSLVLDAAMTNCLFARGVTAATAELVVRFIQPARTDCPTRVRARVKSSRPPLYCLEADLWQADMTVAKASAKFLERKLTPGDQA